MDPAEGVQDVFWYVFRVYAIYGVSHVLSRGHDQTERDQNDHSDRVVQSKYRRVYVHIIDLDQILESAEDVQHCKEKHAAGLGASTRSSEHRIFIQPNISTPLSLLLLQSVRFEIIFMIHTLRHCIIIICESASVTLRVYVEHQYEYLRLAYSVFRHIY